MNLFLFLMRLVRKCGIKNSVNLPVSRIHPQVNNKIVPVPENAEKARAADELVGGWGILKCAGCLAANRICRIASGRIGVMVVGLSLQDV